MFNAIANFIFGGILSEVQDESSQFETTEVNDWLLVNIPNQPIDDMEVITDDDDDFLEDIHHILPMEDSCDNSFSDVISPSVLFQQKPLDHSVATQTSFLIEECLQDFQTFPEHLKMEHSYIYPAEFSLIASQYFGNPGLELFNPIQSVVIVENKRRISTAKTVVVLSKDSKVRSVPDKRICHPAASSKNYVNHQSPVPHPKTALLEQIKELKPMQQAIEYDVKKHASKSQLCRQNKNYIFEGSTKSNRRNKLWRNHSGVNNNRKCN